MRYFRSLSRLPDRVLALVIAALASGSCSLLALWFMSHSHTDHGWHTFDRGPPVTQALLAADGRSDPPASLGQKFDTPALRPSDHNTNNSTETGALKAWKAVEQRFDSLVTRLETVQHRESTFGTAAPADGKISAQIAALSKTVTAVYSFVSSEHPHQNQRSQQISQQLAALSKNVDAVFSLVASEQERRERTTTVPPTSTAPPRISTSTTAKSGKVIFEDMRRSLEEFRQKEAEQLSQQIAALSQHVDAVFSLVASEHRWALPAPAPAAESSKAIVKDGAVEMSSAPLPCVPLLLDLIKSDTEVPIAAKDFLGQYVASLTYESRDKWIRTLNPTLFNKISRDDVQSVCGNRSAKVAIVTVTNGLTPNMQEWVFYHLLLGLERLFVFDHSLPESMEQTLLHRSLQPFIDIGLVVNLESRRFAEHAGDWERFELALYTYVFSTYRAHYDWMGFVGADEFVVLHEKDCLADFLGRYSKYGGVALQWNMYAMLGVRTHDVLRSSFEQYHWTFEDHHHHMKFFVQPNRTELIGQHNHIYVNGSYGVNIQETRVDGPFNVEDPPREKKFGVAELRHFFFFDWNAAFFDKVCGAGEQRKQYIQTRARQVLLNFYRNFASPTVDALPHNYEHLLRLFFRNIRKGQHPVAHH